MYFLTEVDTDRLDIRGSRDPLGFVPLWGEVGRKVVGNLTTASNTFRGFTTLLLGLYLAEQVAPGGRDREKDRLAAFLRFEQLAGYVRWKVNSDGNFRGVTAVKKRLEPGTPVRISADSAGQILSNQRTYGLWGLYMLPSRDSGLVTKGESSLTDEAREFVEKQYRPRIESHSSRHWARLKEIVSKSAVDVDPMAKDKKLFEALGEVLRTKPTAAEHAFYHEHLINGGPASAQLDAWQRPFAAALEKTLVRDDPMSLDGLALVAEKIEIDELRTHLHRIADLERFLVPSANLFGFLQTRPGKSVASVATEVKSKWGSGLKFIAASRLDALTPYFKSAFSTIEAVERLLHCARALRDGDYRDAIEDVISHNGYVMGTRDGVQPWIKIEDGKLDVRYAGETEQELLEASTLQSAWRNTYYIDPLKTVLDQLRSA